MKKGKYINKEFDKNYHELLRLGNLGLWKWDLRTNMIVWLPSYKSLTGLREELSSKTFEDYIKQIYPQDRKRVINKVKSIKKKDNKFLIEYRAVTPDNSVRWFEIRGRVKRDIKKNPVEIQGVFIDITKRKVVEKELKNTASQLKAIFTSAPGGITVESRSGKILYANDAAASLLKVKDSNSLVGLNMRRLFENFEIKDQKDQLYKPNQMPAAQVFRGKKRASKLFSFKNIESGDIKWLKVTATEVDTENGSDMVIKVFQDVSNEIEEQQNTQNTLGMVSHELKNALASVKAYIQLLKRKISKGDLDTSQEYIDALNSQNDRVIKIINDLLDVSRIRAGLFVLNKRKFNYTLLLDKLVNDFKKIYPDNPIRFWRKNPLFVYADEDRIVQVFMNLVSNAVRYSSRGKPILISSFKNGNYIITRVKDKGIGIHKDRQSHIFKLFSRMNNYHSKQTKGLGMGLFITNAIVKGHGGMMSVESSKGKGSTFSFTIPTKAYGKKR